MNLGRIAGLALLVLLALGSAWYLTRAHEIGAPTAASAPEATPAAAQMQPASPAETPKLESTADANRSRLETAPAQKVFPGAKAPTRGNRGSIRGRVVDDLGAAVPRFEIRSTQAGTDKRASDRFFRPSNEEPGKSFESEDGSFLIEGLSKGEWMLTAARKGKITSSPMPASVPAADDALLVLVLPRASTIDGLVVGPDDTLVAGAAVHARIPGKQEPRLHTRGEEPEPLARSDAQGRFHLEDITPGTFSLLASPAEGCDSAWTEVTAAPGARTEVTLRLSAGGRVVGVVDPSCGPTAGREISLYSFSGATGWRETKTDESGRFAIENVVPQRYVVEFRSEREPDGSSGPQDKNIRRNITVKPGETTEVRFSVGQETVVVRGLVRRGGLPVEGLAVGVFPAGTTSSTEKRTQTGSDGGFEVRVEELGEYRFTFSSEQGSYAVFQRIVKESGAAPLVFDLPTGVVSGVVLSPQGKALEYVPVTLLRAPDDPAQPSKEFWERYHSERTDEHGAFLFEFLPAGTYSLRAPDGHRRDSPPPRIPFGGVVIGELRVGDGPCTPLELRLVAEGKISGHVLDSQGVPVAEAGIQVFDTSDVKRCAYYELATDVRGWFEIDSIAAGTYTVGAAKKDRRGRSKPVEVVAGKTAEVKVELP
jgi:protocatechuate 3,4-dioxygenase beta subunit